MDLEHFTIDDEYEFLKWISICEKVFIFKFLTNGLDILVYYFPYI